MRAAAHTEAIRILCDASISGIVRCGTRRSGSIVPNIENADSPHLRSVARRAGAQAIVLGRTSGEFIAAAAGVALLVVARVERLLELALVGVGREMQSRARRSSGIWRLLAPIGIAQGICSDMRRLQSIDEPFIWRCCCKGAAVVGPVDETTRAKGEVVDVDRVELCGFEGLGVGRIVALPVRVLEGWWW